MSILQHSEGDYTTYVSVRPNSLDTRGKMPYQVNENQTAEFTLETFINNLQLDLYRLMNEEAKDEYLEKYDALDMFTAVQEINRELAIVKLENHFLIDFLERNDPKMLIGLKTRRFTATAQRRTTTTSSVGSARLSNATPRRSISSRPSETVSMYNTSQSNYTGASKKGPAGMHSGQMEYRLNYKSKCDMAEKATTEVEKRVNEIETKAMQAIKLLNARIEELQFRYDETDETMKNFQLHFLKDERDITFLETAGEKQIERKFKKFVNNWLKNARALLSTMRLRNTALHENCAQLRSDLITKSDLSGILSAVDFEQLMIKRNELLNSLDEKNAHMAGLKSVTGKASLAMSEEKQIMMNIEEESKSIANKTVDVIKNVSQLEREAKTVEEENKKELKILQSLKEQLERYQAPSVNQYVEKKDELLMLEKEEKMLQRKIYILNMKLNNVYKRCAKK
ncbi:coiled-coil domain-containing protein 113 [Zeugodacus cucurbitae]|uniref:coiled-coil domain-containing protein 113 n=1 Tax=Zeugodacus cucurbitae TaxID=28588 RepID=UPI0023D95B4D|nr:coiled-coil domain-containing protein 113 [Zeugodacus cucurbitae]